MILLVRFVSCRKFPMSCRKFADSRAFPEGQKEICLRVNDCQTAPSIFISALVKASTSRINSQRQRNIPSAVQLRPVSANQRREAAALLCIGSQGRNCSLAPTTQPVPSTSVLVLLWPSICAPPLWLPPMYECQSPKSDPIPTNLFETIYFKAKLTLPRRWTENCITWTKETRNERNVHPFTIWQRKESLFHFMHRILYLEEMGCCREQNRNKRKTVFSSRNVDRCISAAVTNINNRMCIFSNFLETCRWLDGN